MHVHVFLKSHTRIRSRTKNEGPYCVIEMQM